MKMTPTDFAEKHFREYRIKGNEIVPTYCPFCQGGNRQDKHTFAMNADTGTFNCKRGSCASSGTFNQLLKEFGEKTMNQKNYEIKQRPKVNYKIPETEIIPISQAEKYLKSRKISKETWESRVVGEDAKGNIVFPYFESGKLVLVKFRPSHKVRPDEKKGWREPGGKPVFWGMDLCNTEKPLVIVEGEIDALSLDEAGISNVVSVPSGSSDLNCVDLCWDWLNQFKKVVIWVDKDEPGQELQRNLINRLGAWRCSIVDHAGRKDANEVLFYDGPEALRSYFRKAVEVPITGLVRVSEIAMFDYSNTTRIPSGIQGIDEAIGGFMTGEVSIWTGKRGGGKSTVLGQVLLEAINNRFVVCSYSGELKQAIFRYWIDLQAAGPGNMEMKFDKIKNKEVAHPKREVVNKIREWYKDHFFLIDSYGSVTDKSLIETFEYAAMRYGCKVFSIDNLMTTEFTSEDRDFYRKQSEFVKKLIVFAQKYDAHIHLIAHPRKSDNSVSGTADTENRADNIFIVNRLSDKDKKDLGVDTVIDIDKNRFSGTQDVSVGLHFIPECKRFHMFGERPKQFGWDEPTIYEAGQLFATEA